ncbi:thioredoxin domain-containing protein [Patescibacteria group bacterium]|nr:thioredoxin domain-containing protein [Patescibacteria group bacterium]
MKSALVIPVAIVVSGIILAAAVYLSLAKPAAPVRAGDPSLVRPVSASDHILGNPAAKVMIVEYADFDCEYCKGFNETLHQIIATEGANGEVAWVFRHFPLSEIHPDALALAKAAECAAEVGGNDAFWKFTDALYARQPVAPAAIGTIAAVTNVPADTFATCYASESTSAPLLERIQADRKNALAMGATGVPYSLILVRGKLPVVVDGAYSYDDLKTLVDQSLQ